MVQLICEGMTCNPHIHDIDGEVSAERRHHNFHVSPMPPLSPGLIARLHTLRYTPHVSLTDTMWACVVCQHARQWGGNPSIAMAAVGIQS